MAKINLPYHKQMVKFEIDDKYLKGILVSKIHEFKTEKTEVEIIREAMENPIHSLCLDELIKGKNNMVIITSDHTRPVPSSITLPIILETIRRTNPKIDITIAVATGSHREITKSEMIEKYGREVTENENFFIHRASDKSQMISLGILDTGLNAEVNRVIVETEFLMAEGFIEPHFFAGFSGGRKSVFPGMASIDCIRANHCSEYISNDKARVGILEGNPIHNEALGIAKLAGLRYILNVVLNKDKKVIKAFAGDYNAAHLAGCAFVSELSFVKAVPADIVITTNGGYPLDQNIYQSVKGISAAEISCKEGGVIIMLASCCDGHGGDTFYNTFRNASSPEEIISTIADVKRMDTALDQWESQILAKILKNHNVIMVTDMCEKKLVETFMMKHASTIGDALVIAREMMGREATVTIIPDGVSVIVK